LSSRPRAWRASARYAPVASRVSGRFVVVKKLLLLLVLIALGALIAKKVRSS
jgi:hypothetical protein